MRIGLVSYRCKNRDVSYNVSQIEEAMRHAEGKVDLLCFGEAFLQGFDALCWDYDADLPIALSFDSEIIARLCALTARYGVSLLTGYIEKDREKLYSSCIVISDGKIVHNYRRISKGWKEYSRTDEHYCEGNDTRPFGLHGRNICLALCGAGDRHIQYRYILFRGFFHRCAAGLRR